MVSMFCDQPNLLIGFKAFDINRLYLLNWEQEFASHFVAEALYGFFRYSAATNTSSPKEKVCQFVQ